MTIREQRAAEAQALRDQGMVIREIGARLGLSRSYTSALLHDPDGSKDRVRKQTYGGTCTVCGKRTDGSNGRTRAPSLCVKHAAQKQHDDRYWTQERILEAFHRFYDEYGDQPSATETLNLRPGLWFPGVNTVQREFGSWSAAIKAAGWKPGAKRPPREETMGDGIHRYVILRENGDGAWHVAGESDGPTRDKAMKDFIQGGGGPGRYVTVPISSWAPRRFRVEMRPTLITEGD